MNASPEIPSIFPTSGISADSKAQTAGSTAGGLEFSNLLEAQTIEFEAELAQDTTLVPPLPTTPLNQPVRVLGVAGQHHNIISGQQELETHSLAVDDGAPLATLLSAADDGAPIIGLDNIALPATAKGAATPPPNLQAVAGTDQSAGQIRTAAETGAALVGTGKANTAAQPSSRDPLKAIRDNATPAANTAIDASTDFQNSLSTDTRPIESISAAIPPPTLAPPVVVASDIDATTLPSIDPSTATTFATAQSALPQVLQSTSAVAPAQISPPILAKPADIPALVSESIPTVEPGNDRVVVQLDPPELGRVTIDFKFDGQILQGVTITGETPEALRQLRHMHFELIQALEQNGLANGDLSFRQELPQERHPDQASADTLELDENLEAAPSPDWPTSPARKLGTTDSGLDIKI